MKLRRIIKKYACEDHSLFEIHKMAFHNRLALFALLYFTRLIYYGLAFDRLWVSWEQIWRYQIIVKSTQFDEPIKFGGFIKYLVIIEFLSK